MTPRVSCAAIEMVRAMVEEHLRQEYAWSVETPSEDFDIDESDFAGFLYAALEYARATHPLTGRDGMVVDGDEIVREPGDLDLFTALLHLEPKTPDTCLDTLVEVLSIEVRSGESVRRTPVPRVYSSFPPDWPEVLGYTVGDAEYTSWRDNVFGVVAGADWILRQDRRAEVFAVLDPSYPQLSFVEVDQEVAHRLACFLLAGFKDRASFEVFDRQASAFVSLFGPLTRCYSNRDLTRDELRDPFAHGEPIDLGTRDQCAGASTLVLLTSDGRRVARLEALWDVWVES